MAKDVRSLRDRIIEAILSEPEIHLWHWSSIEHAAKSCQLQDGMAATLFPNGMIDAVAHFSDYLDRQMLSALDDIPYQALRSKDRVRAAVIARLGFMESYREIMRQTLAFWAMPTHVLQGQRILWRTSDRIWDWAGDKATDYSRHTKRAMLASILVGTEMVWITDDSKDFMVTQAFLDRRLENTMEIGKTIGTMKTVVPNLFRHIRSK
ncbi:MAG TPA: COQ9 family protein [Alphaproteobacteria bacterium]|nr:COQ9 family protein [Alphaproteobacteria bacterium]